MHTDTLLPRFRLALPTQGSDAQEPVRSRNGRVPVQRTTLDDAVRDRLLFAQVREDPRLELEALGPDPDSSYVVVGSGGCTVLSLLAAGAGRVVAVDTNRSQNDLLELKYLSVLELGEGAVAFLGGAPSAEDRWVIYGQLRTGLTDGARSYWDTRRAVIRSGVLGAGVTERLVRLFVSLLRVAVHRRATMDELLAMPSVDAQDRFFTERWNNWRWRALVRLLLSRRTLSRTYDPTFFSGVDERNFAPHFQERIEHVLRRLPVRDNYFLHHMLTGRYPTGIGAGLPPYLEPVGRERLRRGGGTLEIVDGSYSAHLERCGTASVDGFAVSNIAEWLDEDGVERLFAQVARTAAPGARLCFRNFVGWTEVPRRWRQRLQEDRPMGERLMGMDRSLVQRRFAICRIATSDPEGPDRLLVDDAADSDDAALSRLAAECPMDGDVAICAEREPSFLALSRLEGDRTRVAVTRDGDGRPVGCITVAERACHQNGVPARIAYVGDLKVHPSFRSESRADALSAWGRDVIEEALGPRAPILITVLAGNRAMERRLSGSPRLPSFRRVGTIRSYSVPVLARRRLSVGELDVAWASPSDLAEMSELWGRVAPLRQFSPVLTAESWHQWLDRAPGLSLERYLLARDGQDNLVGLVGLWDQRSFKQLRVVRYARRMRAFRRVFNGLAPLLGASRLPAAGSLMPCASAVHLCVPPDRPEVLRALLSAAHSKAARAGHAFFNVGLDVEDPLTPAFRGLFAQTTDVHVYLSSASGSYAGPPLDGRPLHHEISLV